VPVRTEVEVHPLEAANEAIDSIRSGSLKGAAVLRVASPGANPRWWLPLPFSEPRLWLPTMAGREKYKTFHPYGIGPNVSGKDLRFAVGTGTQRRGRPRRSRSES